MRVVIGLLCVMNRAEIELRISQLTSIIEQDPTEEQYWLERGTLYWKIQDWSRCISDFDHVIAINPNSPAVELRQMVMRIIRYYYKDQFNP